MILPAFILAQKADNNQIKEMVQKFKNDPKGPYKDIRWFCKDGTTRPPQERCPEPGVQHARYKDEVVNLGNTNHIYLGQILTPTEYKEFWDEANYNSRLKQYQAGNYLRRTDNGWILKKAQYYRGAVQAEDEEIWGIGFFNWLLSDVSRIDKSLFLIRESIKDIPHRGDDNKTLLVRSLSKEISDSVPSFLDIRVKIHGQPEAIDIETVKKFKELNTKKLSKNQLAKIDELIKNMEIVFQPADINSLNRYLKNIPKNSKTATTIQGLMPAYNGLSAREKITRLSQLLFTIREEIPRVESSAARLSLLDISVKLEEMLFRELPLWEDKTLNDLLTKTMLLSNAAAGCGYIEMWEFDALQKQYGNTITRQLSLEELNGILETSRRFLEWSAGMYRGVYKDVIDLYSGFEPLVAGFNDDRIRSTILLYLGNCVSNLGEFISIHGNLSNKVLDISGQSHIRGLNPGYAFGELVVVNELSENADISGNKIYVFNHPPSDMKPVAGIATVTEGNLVSHVQLLARNLGIPNAVLSSENLEELKKYSGSPVFYAVSNKGTVIMKTADKMTETEKQLFSTKKRNEEKITVPVNRIDLNQTKTVNLRIVNAKQSGVLCGPKAANLGQLKQMFPENVVEGFVIPFGIFKQHMDQIIPEKKISYWAYLNSIFDKAEEMMQQGLTQDEIDKYTLAELEILRNDIKAMQLKPEFIADIENSFQSGLGKKLGEIPVFLRSDTNMEDLKDFTGAGLNLTIFNVLDKEKILQGIKDVWASPYSERSYKWRQRYLLNPENVYPSILVIPSVDVDYSGVLITKGILSDDDEDLTIAYSRGAGGAVDGQAAESWLCTAGGDNILVSPSREPFYNSLPEKGGTGKKSTTFEKPILSNENLNQIRDFAQQVKHKMATDSKTKSDGPFDIELGFKDNKIWLFQIRPFVENKNAVRSEYLISISPVLPPGKIIDIDTSL